MISTRPEILSVALICLQVRLMLDLVERPTPTIQAAYVAHRRLIIDAIDYSSSAFVCSLVAFHTLPSAAVMGGRKASIEAFINEFGVSWGGWSGAITH